MEPHLSVLRLACLTPTPRWSRRLLGGRQGAAPARVLVLPVTHVHSASLFKAVVKGQTRSLPWWSAQSSRHSGTSNNPEVEAQAVEQERSRKLQRRGPEGVKPGREGLQERWDGP